MKGNLSPSRTYIALVRKTKTKNPSNHTFFRFFPEIQSHYDLRKPPSYTQSVVAQIVIMQCGCARKENYRTIFLMKTDIIFFFNKTLANQIKQHVKRTIHHDQVRFISEMQRQFNIHKSINVIHHINRMGVKNHAIISRDTEKAFYKIQIHS